jgi:post-segregation antitoxin (ccd killing protein)
VNTFAAQGGNLDEAAMLEFTKQAEGGDGVNWTLRLQPGSSSGLVHEATVSFPVSEGNRVLGGLIPDYQGYEYVWAHQNPLLTHNALFDYAGPTAYAGIGMTHALTSSLAAKWMIGNIDGASDDTGVQSGVDNLGLPSNTRRSVGLAYRFDLTLSEYAYAGFAAALGSAYRNFGIYEFDGGYVRGDLTLNGQVTIGTMNHAAYNGELAEWTGLSGLVGYKVAPRLQLLARADYIENQKNGGGTYVANYFNAGAFDPNGTAPMSGTGLGPRLDELGTVVVDDSGNPIGANLARLSLGTNYQINASTQWKTEIRYDQSTGFNFVNESGTPTNNKTTFGTSVVVFF